MWDYENNEKVRIKPENKEAGGVKFINQYKYLGLNFQNTGRLTAQLYSLKIKLKKNDKNYFLLQFNNKFLPSIIFKKIF
jgi:murein L,D-transpeptidase YafK